MEAEPENSVTEVVPRSSVTETGPKNFAAELVALTVVEPGVAKDNPLRSVPADRN